MLDCGVASVICAFPVIFLIHSEPGFHLRITMIRANFKSEAVGDMPPT